MILNVPLRGVVSESLLPSCRSGVLSLALSPEKGGILLPEFPRDLQAHESHLAPAFGLLVKPRCIEHCAPEAREEHIVHQYLCAPMLAEILSNSSDRFATTAIKSGCNSSKCCSSFSKTISCLSVLMSNALEVCNSVLHWSISKA